MTFICKKLIACALLINSFTSYANEKTPRYPRIINAETAQQVTQAIQAKQQAALAKAITAAQKFDNSFTNRIFCTDKNCWQRAITCFQHIQPTYLRLKCLPMGILDNICQFLGPLQNLLHTFEKDQWDIWTPGTRAIRLKITKNAEQNYELTPEKMYPTILLSGDGSPWSVQPDEKDIFALYYSSKQDRGKICRLSSAEFIGQQIMRLKKDADYHILGRVNRSTEPPSAQTIISHYCALRLLGLPLKSVQQYNVVKTDFMHHTQAQEEKKS